MTPELHVDAAKKARIEIIPLIDVVFFLLATFVLFTLSLNKLKVIMVPLPKGGEKTEVDIVFIQASIDAFYWKEGKDAPAELVLPTELRPRLVSYAKRVKESRVMVRGDRTAKYGAAIAVLDEARLAGIKEVSVETMTSETGK